MISVVCFCGVSAPWAAYGQTLTGPDVLERCKRAYEALQSYEGVTRLTAHANVGGRRQDYNLSARIRYAAPGRLRVEGSLMDAGTYQYLSDGRRAWSLVSYSRNGWEAARSTDSAIARFATLTLSAGTSVPALLVRSRFGNPLAESARADRKVVPTSIKGRAVYRVHLRAGTADQDLWIDQKTFLLVQRQSRSGVGGGGGGNAGSLQGGGMMSVGVSGGADTFETFEEVKLNSPIDPAVFAPPGRR